MSVKFYVYPYKQGSKSARALATALGGKVLRREGSSFIPRENKKVINWGSSSCPYSCLNTPNTVSRVGNKLDFFQKFLNLSEELKPRFPLWTTSRAEALDMLESNHSKAIVARTILTGHSGAGIVIKDKASRNDLPACQLYVEYVSKDAEYRVHIIKNQQGDLNVIDVQRKVRDPSKEPSDWKIRSHANGFIFTRRNGSNQRHQDICPSDVLIQAKKALGSSGLTFGAVDVIWNQKRENAYVLEINTAPGLEGETIGIYRDAINGYYTT